MSRTCHCSVSRGNGARLKAGTGNRYITRRVGVARFEHRAIAYYAADRRASLAALCDEWPRSGASSPPFPGARSTTYGARGRLSRRGYLPADLMVRLREWPAVAGLECPRHAGRLARHGGAGRAARLVSGLRVRSKWQNHRVCFSMMRRPLCGLLVGRRNGLIMGRHAAVTLPA
jgi:hypothetical protein